MVWSLGQVAAGILSYWLPAAVRAQQLEVRQLQTLSPCIRVSSWVEKRVDQPDLTVLVTGEGGGVPDLLVYGKSVPSGSQKHVCRIMAVLGGRNTQVVLSSQEITGVYFFLIFPFSQIKKNHVPWVLFKKKIRSSFLLNSKAKQHQSVY